MLLQSAELLATLNKLENDGDTESNQITVLIGIYFCHIELLQVKGHANYYFRIIINLNL